MANQNANDNDTNVINADNNGSNVAIEMTIMMPMRRSAMSAVDQRARQER